MNSKLLGYRKLLLTLFAFLASIALLGLKMITAENFVDLNKFVIPAFLASNLAESWMNLKRESKE